MYSLAYKEGAQFGPGCKWLTWPHLNFLGPTCTSKAEATSCSLGSPPYMVAWQGEEGMRPLQPPSPGVYVAHESVCVSCLCPGAIAQPRLPGTEERWRERGTQQDTQAYSQVGVLGVARAWAGVEEDPGTWAKARMGSYSWSWLRAGVAPAWSPRSSGS